MLKVVTSQDLWIRHAFFRGSGYVKRFLESEREWGGIGVKEKNGVAPSVKDGVPPSVKVVFGNSTGTQEANSGKAGHDNLHDENVWETPSNFTANPNKSTSYANLFTANTVYGFFLGKRVAYPVVTNYVRNTWGKYGLVKSMLNSSTRIFSFQYRSIDGSNAVLENGPWFIRNNLFILKKWDPDVNILKEDVVNIPVWVKLHGVPVTAFSGDGLSAIATRLGTPLMFDSYTSDMCIQSCGRSSCARTLIEGITTTSPTPQGAAVVAVPSSDRHHDGGSTVTVAAKLSSTARHGWKSRCCGCCGGGCGWLKAEMMVPAGKAAAVDVSGVVGGGGSGVGCVVTAAVDHGGVIGGGCWLEVAPAMVAGRRRGWRRRGSGMSWCMWWVE
nr:hypothetical protein [Tanacetum cinerariifolium]